MGYSMGGEDQEASEEYVDDHCIETLGKIEHVESAQPVYQMSVLLLKGSYEGQQEVLPKRLLVVQIQGEKDSPVFPAGSYVLCFKSGPIPVCPP